MKKETLITDKTKAMPYDVNGSASEKSKTVHCFMCKNFAQSFTPVWCAQCKNENYSLYEPKR